LRSSCSWPCGILPRLRRLAISPIIIFSDGTDAKNLALNAVAATFLLELDNLLLDHGTPRKLLDMIPKSIKVSKREGEARDCSSKDRKPATPDRGCCCSMLGC
jgi:hypothetical protein